MACGKVLLRVPPVEETTHIQTRWTQVAELVGTRHADREQIPQEVVNDSCSGLGGTDCRTECAKRWTHSLDPNSDQRRLTSRPRRASKIVDQHEDSDDSDTEDDEDEKDSEVATDAGQSPIPRRMPQRHLPSNRGAMSMGSTTAPEPSRRDAIDALYTDMLMMDEHAPRGFHGPMPPDAMPSFAGHESHGLLDAVDTSSDPFEPWAESLQMSSGLSSSNWAISPNDVDGQYAPFPGPLFGPEPTSASHSSGGQHCLPSLPRQSTLDSSSTGSSFQPSPNSALTPSSSSRTKTVLVLDGIRQSALYEIMSIALENSSKVKMETEETL
jgi:hypothetical protein